MMLKKNGKKLLAAFAILVFLLLMYFFSEKLAAMIKDVDTLKGWLDRFGSFQYVIFVLLVSLQVIAAVIPGGPFQVAGGLLYGTIPGIVLCMLGCTLGSIIVFLLVRKYGMRLIRFFISEDALEKAKFIIESKKSRLLLSVCFIIPGTPKDVISYIAGLTNISFFHWLLICSFGRLPGILLSVFAGNAFRKNNYTHAIIAFVILAVIGALGALWYRQLSKKR